MTEQRTPRKRGGRPPGGLRPGEQTSHYPQYVGRVPQEALDTLKAIAAVRGQPQWRVLSDAVALYVERLPDTERRLLAELMNRARPVLDQPTRAVGAPAPHAVVLNVDDNDAMRYARTRILETEGYKVIEAATGRAALHLLDRHKFDVVLLDVNLPDMSGLEVSRTIREDPRFDSLKIVQTSATFSTPHDQLEGLVAGGADIYLAEPVPRGTLLSLLRRLLSL